MKALYSVVSMVALAALAACGGGSDGSPSSGGGVQNPGNGSNNPPPVVLLNDVPQIIEYHGDSTVWGYSSGTTGDRVNDDIRPPTVFAAALPDRHQVINMGRNGTSVCDLLRGEGAYLAEPAQPAWQEHMSNSNATVVIINHGINDVNRGDVAAYRQCLNQVVDIAQAEGKVVILETPNPITDGRLEAFVEAMRSVATTQGVDVIDQYAHLSEAFEQNPDEVCPDGIHPSDAIYVEKGRYAASQFATFASPR